MYFSSLFFFFSAFLREKKKGSEYINSVNRVAVYSTVVYILFRSLILASSLLPDLLAEKRNTEKDEADVCEPGDGLKNIQGAVKEKN